MVTTNPVLSSLLKREGSTDRVETLENYRQTHQGCDPVSIFSVEPLRRCFGCLLVGVLGFALISTSRASASAEPRPGHSCPCQKHCKGSSCCCPDDVTSPPKSSPGERGPCLGTLPCGSGDVPSAAPGTSLPKATWTEPLLHCSDRSDRKFSRLTNAGKATVRTSRIDDPPEACT
jgi:hypothetical protein